MRKTHLYAETATGKGKNKKHGHKFGNRRYKVILPLILENCVQIKLSFH